MSDSFWEYIPAFRQLELGIRSSILDESSFFKEFQDWQLRTPGVDPIHPLFQAWERYSKAQYGESATIAFKLLRSTDSPFLEAHASLVLAKVCSDCGYFESAANYASFCMNLSRKHEMTELMASASGTLGEVYLRAGNPLLALEMFELDDALLPVGSKWKGRVLCYKAHAYSRLHAHQAARLAYRDAEFRPGENSRLYVLAGLVLHAVDHSDPEPLWFDRLFRELEEFSTDQKAQNALPMGWLYWAKAYYCEQQSQHRQACDFLARSATVFSPYYALEISFVVAWATVSELKIEINAVGDPSVMTLPLKAIEHVQHLGGFFERAFTETHLDNSGFYSLKWKTSRQELLRQRLIFMP